MSKNEELERIRIFNECLQKLDRELTHVNRNVFEKLTILSTVKKHNNHIEMIKGMLAVFTSLVYSMNEQGEFETMNHKSLSYHVLKKKGLKYFIENEIRSLLNAYEERN